MEKVQTKEDVFTIFEAAKRIKRMKLAFMSALKENPTESRRLQRDIARTRQEIKEKYDVLI